MQRETWREKRSTTIRLDYAKLHSTGERVVLDDNTPESTSREQSESEYETAVESEAGVICQVNFQVYSHFTPLMTNLIHLK